MNKFLSRHFLFLALLTASFFAPSVYAQTFAPAEAQKQFEASLFIRTELFFGRNKPDGTEVSQKEFDEFLSDFITPRFPDGLTVLKGNGQFLNSSGTVEREKSVLLILLYPINARKDKHPKIEEIRAAYVTRFKQQSVLRVDFPTPMWVSF